MFKLTNLFTASLAASALTIGLLSFSFSAIAKDKKLNIGSPATQEQIAGWDIDVRPDGKGLPPGSGSVLDGETLYEEQCAVCHGVFGEGQGNWPVLAGGEGTLREARPEKTVGSYWPYLSTLWDYIHRAMPFLTPQTLSDDEVYALTAYVLYLNEMVEDDFVLSQENFTTIKMSNEGSFKKDPRPDVHNKRCMNKCVDPDSIRVSWDSPPPSEAATAKPVESSVVKVSEGEATYKTACAVCHDSGLAGAPAVNDSAAWQDRIKQGLSTLNDHAINGYQGAAGVMPAKGGNSSLSDEAVKAAVEHMIIQY
ncbi:MAG: cytochrome c5 [Arenicella sp.]|jgi:cytochrome c5